MSATSTSNRALVLGRGKSGEAAATELRRRGYDVDFAEDYAVVVASPGVPVKSELQLGCEELKRRGWKLLAVTGSKGKSSVVKVVADGLCRAGLHAVACGNYGLPVCEVFASSFRPSLSPSPSTSTPTSTSTPDFDSSPWAIVEVSSFMLETTALPPDLFEAAAILNLQEDHLDRHGSVEVYHALKRRLTSFAKRDVSPTDEVSAEDAALLVGSYFDNAILRSNGLVAVRLMRVAGLGDEAIREAFRSFEPLPHRFQLVAELEGVRYVDDSKATSLAALVAGVTMCRETVAEPSVRLIAGGLPKGDDPEIASSALTSRVKKVYLIGQSAGVFSKAWSRVVDCEICDTLERAVETARRESAKGETVLLSPGAASFDQFNSFGERGEVFARLVKRERKNR